MASHLLKNENSRRFAACVREQIRHTMYGNAPPAFAQISSSHGLKVAARVTNSAGISCSQTPIRHAPTTMAMPEVLITEPNVKILSLGSLTLD